VVPSAPDYSGTPLVKKLGIRSGSRVALIGAPRDFDETLGELPEGVAVARRLRGELDVVLLFCRTLAELQRRLPKAHEVLAPRGGLWVAWPKKASGVATDLTQATVRSFGLGSNFVDYKICAIDEIWSGLLFARRKSQ
jgi:hypothetical protein